MSAVWYTVATEINTGDGWRRLHPPTIEVSELAPQRLIENEIENYELEDITGQWIIRVYEGYGRFETVLAEASGGQR